MTDTGRGMEGSKHRILKLTRAVVSSAILAGVVALAGCGGGGGNKPAAPPPPVNAAPSSGGVVGAEGTQGLVGPVERATHKGTSFADRSGKFSPKANQKPGAQKHRVAGGAA